VRRLLSGVARSTIKLLIVVSLLASVFPVSPAYADDNATQIVQLVNAARVQHGLTPLVVSPELTQSARQYAQSMATGGFFSHQGPHGSTLITRDESAGYRDWTTLGENLAGGQPTPAEAVRAWLNSPEHRANILSDQYQETGVGFVTVSGSPYEYYWVQEFGNRPTIPVVYHSVILNPSVNSSWQAPTGYLVTGDWLTYLRAHGDVDAFGLPRSNVVADPSHGGQLVQYFQRGVLEWHPENPPGSQIEPRLLGDILYPGADPPVSPNDAPPGPSTYFPVTPGQSTGLGHFVADYLRNGQPIYFKQFFDSHGGVATFGYPKEEPKLRNGIWTQRFQAATFEYHPEFDRDGYVAGTNIPLRHYRVQLELLGDEYIAINGLPPP